MKSYTILWEITLFHESTYREKLHYFMTLRYREKLHYLMTLRYREKLRHLMTQSYLEIIKYLWLDSLWDNKTILWHNKKFNCPMKSFWCLYKIKGNNWHSTKKESTIMSIFGLKISRNLVQSQDESPPYVCLSDVQF